MQRLILILIAIVLCGIAGFALIWFGAGRDLQGPSVAFLTHCRDGAFEKAYAEAHPRFREARSLEQLEALWAHWTGRYGPFGEVVRRINVVAAPEGASWEEELRLDLGFLEGHVVGSFFFLTDEDGVPKLAHVSLEPRSRVDVPETDRSRLELKARKLVGWYDEARWLDLYDAFGPSLQMGWTQRRMMAELPALHARLGSVKDIVLLDTSDIEAGVRQRFALTCEHGPAELEVVHAHAEGSWSVVGFDLR